jgi:CheY-like chemotaxis protein
MRHKIYLIDDDEDLLRSFQVILESKGYDVITSSDSRDCYEKLQSEKPDLLVLDVMMRTEFEGYELLQKLKSDPAYRNLPVILLTGMRDQIGIDLISVVEDETLFPRVNYQDKPVYSHELLSLIEKMLSDG